MRLIRVSSAERSAEQRELQVLAAANSTAFGRLFLNHYQIIGERKSLVVIVASIRRLR
jgi:hypothetical protein